jgi:transposase-like protein
MTQIKPMNIKQLAALYGVHRSTMTRWLIPFRDKIGKRTGNLFTPKQVRIIFDCLGEP